VIDPDSPRYAGLPDDQLNYAVLRFIPNELIEEVGAVVVDHTRGTLLGMSPIGDRLREVEGPGTTLCGVLVLACTLAEREGKPVPPPLLAAATRLLSGGYVEVLW
jgi:hypothetical protein